jgi:hypothetical protein
MVKVELYNLLLASPIIQTRTRSASDALESERKKPKFDDDIRDGNYIHHFKGDKNKNLDDAVSKRLRSSGTVKEVAIVQAEAMLSIRSKNDTQVMNDNGATNILASLKSKKSQPAKTQASNDILKISNDSSSFSSIDERYASDDFGNVYYPNVIRSGRRKRTLQN